MRIITDLQADGIIQVEADSRVGTTTLLNGRYSIPVPAGQVEVDASSYVLPLDPGSVVTQAYNGLLDSFPAYSFIEFNPLLESANINDLDLTATLDNTGLNVINDVDFEDVFVTRAQTGRGSAPFALGNAPNATALLSVNETGFPTAKKRPGLLVSDTIDISAQLSGGETDSFLVYWKVYRISLSEDVNASYGALAGQNTPALKTLEEVDPNTSDLVVALSNNDGNLYTPVRYLEPFSACITGNQLRIAFINTGSEKIYLAGYAILF